MGKMSEFIHLPLASASIELEHVIVDGSPDRAVLATCSEPQRSAFVRAVNCYDEMLEALKLILEEKAPRYHDCTDDGLPKCAWCFAEEAVAKAEGRS